MKLACSFNGENIYKHSFKDIDLIMSLLKSLRTDKNNWIIDIVFLIMTHQSLDNNTIRPHDPVFSSDQIKKYYDRRLLELSLIVYVNDSTSYTLFCNNDFVKQINFYQIKFRELLGYK